MPNSMRSSRSMRLASEKLRVCQMYAYNSILIILGPVEKYSKIKYVGDFQWKWSTFHKSPRCGHWSTIFGAIRLLMRNESCHETTDLKRKKKLFRKYFRMLRLSYFMSFSLASVLHIHTERKCLKRQFLKQGYISFVFVFLLLLSQKCFPLVYFFVCSLNLRINFFQNYN